MLMVYSRKHTILEMLKLLKRMPLCLSILIALCSSIASAVEALPEAEGVPSLRYYAPSTPANPPKTIFTAAQIAEGGPMFEQNCGLCHGAGARSGGVVPDLRRSAALDDPALWNEIVLKGAP